MSTVGLSTRIDDVETYNTVVSGPCLSIFMQKQIPFGLMSHDEVLTPHKPHTLATNIYFLAASKLNLTMTSLTYYLYILNHPPRGMVWVTRGVSISFIGIYNSF